jgi:nucleoside permease NupC
MCVYVCAFVQKIIQSARKGTKSIFGQLHSACSTPKASFFVRFEGESLFLLLILVGAPKSGGEKEEVELN